MAGANDGLVISRTKVKCKECDDFVCNSANSYAAHFREVHLDNETARETIRICPLCDEQINGLIRHGKKHSERYQECTVCQAKFATPNLAFTHYQQTHSIPDGNMFIEIESAFQKNIQTFSRKFIPGRIATIEEGVSVLAPQVNKLIKHQIDLKHSLRYSVVLFGQYVKQDDSGLVHEESVVPLRSKSETVFQADKPRIHRSTRRICQNLELRHEQLLLAGSGWTLDHVVGVNVEVGRVFYRGYSNQSKPFLKIAKKNGVRKHITDIPLTHKNDCFITAVAAGLIDKPPKASVINSVTGHLINNIVRTKFSRYKGKGMELSKIRYFEKRFEKDNFSINVFGLDQWGVKFPMYNTRYKKKKVAKSINLLLLRRYNTCTKKHEHHYSYIYDLEAFYGTREFCCEWCMNVFTSPKALENHQTLCARNEIQKTIIPKFGDTVQFEKYKKRALQPLFGTLDFEATMKDPEGENSRSNTIKLKKQVPTTYSILVRDIYGETIYQKTASSEKNLLPRLFKSFKNIEHRVGCRLNRFRDCPKLTEEEAKAYAAATHCYLCEKKFGPAVRPEREGEELKLKKVRDHDHYTGKFIAAAHWSCNLDRRIMKKIPIFIHNMSSYDSHFLIQGLKYMKEGKQVSGIPLNMEKFKTLQIGMLSFVDSCSLLPASLAELTENLRTSDHDFPVIQEMTASAEEKELLFRKGVYPYEWAESVEQLRAADSVPPIEAFFSKLTQQNISVEDYEHAKKVFKFFKCDNMLDYTELYCKLDVILLYEIMTAFQKMIFDNFTLDCTQYISTPQLAYDAMLQMLDEPVELMSDPDMILLCENNIRGGVSFVGERHVKLENYHPDQLEHLLYIDANNLYSVAQSAPMPIKDYAWCTADEIKSLEKNIMQIDINSLEGYIMEVDLSYPEKIHDQHSAFPLAAEQMEFSYDNLSPFSRKVIQLTRGRYAERNYKSKKLCTTLIPKKKYVGHYRNIQTYLRNGMKLDKIHRVIRFQQKDYIKAYIDKCTKLRATATTAFKRLLMKLMCNSVYGRFIMNERNFQKSAICHKPMLVNKHMSDEAYKTHKILDENLVVIYKTIPSIQMNKLYATGMSILELSKDHMNRAVHEFIQPALGVGNVNIVLTDTDSIVLHVTGMTRDDMLDRLSPIMDFSNYDQSHPRYDTSVKAIPGYFKDENQGKYLTEIVALRSKCYVTHVEGNEKAVCKGINAAARRTLTLEKYRDCVQNFTEIKAKMFSIQSKTHVIHTLEINKIALSAIDDKRHYFSCGKHSVPHGSFRARRKECWICGK